MATTIQLRPLARAGGRRSRQEAIARSRSGSLLILCLTAEKAPRAFQEPILRVELAFMASKKQVSKMAVERNRLKRRLRHAALVLKTEHSCGAISEDEDVCLQLILVGHRDQQSITFEDLEKQIITAFKKLLDELIKLGRV